ncbi:hypothetical protein DVH24_012375 [Malus domestica]|uniref:Lachrymatory-factor synthase n=1 Tax=Malus domestica TaxID=3750 RepID=A0A498HU69_MALDO|nr:hypothetical protein DVH24_012375 [Malus domestica]
MIDPINHCLSYEITENNFGFKSYVATVQLVPINDEDGRTGCIIEWSFVSDLVEGWKYEDLQAWFPTVSACRQVEGVPGQPDLFRYCASAPVDNDESTIKWSEEKLLTIDPIQRLLSYEVTESNLGFKSYVAMDSGDGCRIEWSFVSDPIEGWGLDDFLSYLDSSVQLIGKTIMEHPSLSATTT